MNINTERPFDGQDHTFFGERGKTEIERIRFRDLADCIATVFLRLCCGDEEVEAEEVYDKLKSLDTSNINTKTFIQGVSCEVEMMMGIFPNITERADEM